eukprot:6212672-Pleurochrysis_carterae.AAC.7
MIRKIFDTKERAVHPRDQRKTLELTVAGLYANQSRQAYTDPSDLVQPSAEAVPSARAQAAAARPQRLPA